MKTLEGTIVENYHFGLDNFLNMTSKAQITIIKSKIFCVSKDTFKKMKRQPTSKIGQNILQIIYLVRMYLEYIKKTLKLEKKHNLKMGMGLE